VIDNSSGLEYLVNQKSMTVKLKNGVSAVTLGQLNLANNVIKVSENALGYINLKMNSNSSFAQMYNLYNQSGLFDYITINSFGEIHSNDPGYYIPGSDYQYYLFNNPLQRPHIQAGDALWELEDGSPSVKVAVIDLGVDIDHWDLVNGQDNYANYGPDFGWDYIDNPDNSPDPLQIDNHGTSIAGIIAAKTNNNKGCAGIAGGWGNAGVKIIALRVGKYEDNPPYPELPGPRIRAEHIASAIIYAADHGAKVINMSFGIPQRQDVINAINYAYFNKNCLLIASAGQNTSRTNDPIAFPANYTFVMAVGGIDLSFQHYGFYTGPKGLDVVAPSHSIYSLLNSTQQIPDKWGYVGGVGTSFSSAEVSGIAALCYSHNSNLLQMDVRKMIKQFAHDDFPGYQELYFGKGIAQAGMIIDYLQAPTENYPQQPTSLTISGSVGQHPTLHWPKVADGFSYKIYRANDIDGRYLFQNIAAVNYVPGLNNYSWTDNSITITDPKQSGTTYYYRITSYDAQLNYESISSNEVTTWSNTINKENSFTANSLYQYELFDNYPNPFNPKTSINFSLKKSGWVKLEVFNSIGQQVQVLVNEIKSEGKYSVSFDAGKSPSGMYFYRLTSDKFSDVKKMLLIK
jgi:subtilisin family serine protease